MPGRPSAAEVARRALMRRVKPVDPDAHRIAQEVYEACVTLKPGAANDPLPLAVRGPLFAINVRALEVIKVNAPGVVTCEQDADDVMAYLTEVWCAAMLGFDRGHFAAWRSRQDSVTPIVRPESGN